MDLVTAMLDGTAYPTLMPASGAAIVSSSLDKNTAVLWRGDRATPPYEKAEHSHFADQWGTAVGVYMYKSA